MLHLLLCVAVLCQSALALGDTVDLGYARYRGLDIGNGVIRWAGMRYARSVARDRGRRFTAPQDPLDEPGVSDATKFGPVCVGSGTELKSEFGGEHSEDCLFINVFAPSRVTKESKLPVYVFIQGGGFNINGNANYNGAHLIDAGDEDMVVVNFNYRVGPYGFLAGREIVENKTLSLNNGLKDQRQALKWVQKHIQQFGGDPGHVTIGGASAGGGSVVLQLTAFGGRNDGLFHAAAAESPAFPPLRDVENSQWQFDALLKQTGCKDLHCMASLDAVKFQDAVRNMKTPFPGGKNPPLYAWNPTLDKDFVQDFTFNELKNGHYVNVPCIFGVATNDGINFTPKSVMSQSLSQEFLTDQFPSINFNKVRQAWDANMASTADARWRTVTANIYGHIRYTCPTLNITDTYAKNDTNPTWQYRWNVGTASHVGELLPIWNNASSASGVFVQAYWASFIRSYDPNKHAAAFLLAKGSTLTSPMWQDSNASQEKRLVFNDNDDVGMETISKEEWQRCEIINDMGLHLKQPAADGSSDSSGSGSTASGSFSGGSSSPGSPGNSGGSSAPAEPPKSLGNQHTPLSSTYMATIAILLGIAQWSFT
ncbi:PnbA Carboxylesterase type B [Pyrenophora teres f. maculata]|nr:PnbA Carboxylesterase type B [Pyrenophora teres f. maculata]